MQFDEILKTVCGGVCVALFLGLGLLGHYISGRDKKIVRDGVTLFAPIVQANTALFTPGDKDAPAQVLVSFQPDSPELRRTLLQLAERVGGLGTADTSDPLLEPIAALIRDQKRHSAVPLPQSLARGLDVYLTTVFIERDRLPNRYLDRKFVYCRAKPEDKGDSLVMITDAQVEELKG